MFPDLQVQLMTNLENKQQVILRLQEDLNSEQSELKEQVQSKSFIIVTLFVFVYT